MCRTLAFVFVLVPGLLLNGMTPAAGLDITKPGDTIIGAPNDGDWPDDEAPPLAIDDNTGTQYLHFKGFSQPTGFRVTPSARQTIVVGLTFTTANDFPGRDPIAFELYGSNKSIDGPYELIASGDIVDFSQRTEWPRFTMNETPILFDNGVAYDHYQILFPVLRDPQSANSMQIAEVELLGISLTSYSPSPVDGAIHSDTWASLSWTAGDFAVSHDVYIGGNFDAVNEGAEGTFIGNQAATNLVVGFPGFPFPEGLVPGTTYYWRIDDVEANGMTYRGDVWSFTIPPKTAYAPDPADGAKFIDPNEGLSWASGFGAKLHTVYFGDNFDYVNNAAWGRPQADTIYALDTLKLENTYYWRVDEFDIVETHKGDVWSFTTAGEGGGVRANYYQGMNFDSLALTRIDTQINFNWRSSKPATAVGADHFSVRWTGEVEAAFTETYTFYTNSDDGVRLRIDGQRLVNNWTDHAPTEDKGTIDLVAGNTYSLVMEMYENGGDAVAELRWSSPRTPKQLIPQAALSPPIKAGNPKPGNGAVDVKHNQILSWSPGEAAASHWIYFGTDQEAVRKANTGSHEYRGSRKLGSETYDHGILEWNTTYYWRIDENEDDGTLRKGNVWSFKTANFLIVDDFEDYDAGDNQILFSWNDGLGYGAPDAPPYSPGNGTGSAVGDDTTGSYTEETIVHGGNQSMPFWYDNSVFRYSEATLILTHPRDWTEKGVNTLVIWSIGDPANARAPMYVVLNGSAVVQHDDPDAAKIASWNQWNIDLQAFADQGVNLSNVNSITLGLGNRNNPIPGGSGKLYFDDIRLYRKYWPIFPGFPDRPDWPIFPGFQDFPDRIKP